MVALVFMVVIALVVLSVFFRAVVLTILWGWFAVPVFDFHPLSVAQAIGVATVVSLLTHQYVPAKDKDVWGPIGATLLTPVVALLIGWIAKQYL
jgi:hypothetical protein